MERVLGRVQWGRAIDKEILWVVLDSVIMWVRVFSVGVVWILRVE